VSPSAFWQENAPPLFNFVPSKISMEQPEHPSKNSSNIDVTPSANRYNKKIF